MTAYRPARVARLDWVPAGGLTYALRIWGRDEAPPLLMLHGTQDSSATFQFVVDHLADRWRIIAPDWRGHGRTDRAPGYWLHDFVGDLSALAEGLFGDRAVPIVGHSLGGNIAGIYAGLRPARVSHLISLDGFGPLVDQVPVDPRDLLSRHLDGPPARGKRLYPDAARMGRRLTEKNPSLDPARAEWLAQEASEAVEGGRRWLYADGYRRSLPSLRDLDEWGRIWAGITAPVLWVESGHRRPNAPVGLPQEMERRAALIPNLRRVSLPGTHHNLHHDEPERVARLIEDFLAP